MRIEAALIGDLEKVMADELRGAETAVTAGVRAATDGLTCGLRDQVRGAGLGNRLANTWRRKLYPPGRTSLGAAGLVYSKVPEIARAFNDGVTIRSGKGFWLAIPTPAAPRRGPTGKKITPDDVERLFGQRLRFVYRRGAASLLVLDRVRVSSRGRARTAPSRAFKSGRGLASVPMFFLVPQVHLRKRLDVDRLARHWTEALPRLLLQGFREGRR